jgi:hypothetical protein
METNANFKNGDYVAYPGVLGIIGLAAYIALMNIGNPKKANTGCI